MGPKLSRSRRWLVLLGLGVVAAAARVAAAETPRLTFEAALPLPPRYEERVRFWVDVFTRYHLDEAIVHDRLHPENVLAVVPLRVGNREELREIEARYRESIEYLTTAEPWEHPGLLPLFRAPVDPSWIAAARDRVRVQLGQREVFSRGLLRSRHHLDMVQEVLREAGIPETIGFLPHVESSFDARAVSSAGAAGLW